MDLSKIANPLLTNVTAQSMVGVAPIPAAEAEPSRPPWGTLNHLANLASTSSEGKLNEFLNVVLVMNKYVVEPRILVFLKEKKM